MYKLKYYKCVVRCKILETIGRLEQDIAWLGLCKIILNYVITLIMAAVNTCLITADTGTLISFYFFSTFHFGSLKSLFHKVLFVKSLWIKDIFTIQIYEIQWEMEASQRKWVNSYYIWCRVNSLWFRSLQMMY